jgi:hypothetical protein
MTIESKTSPQEITQLFDNLKEISTRHLVVILKDI